MADVINDDIIEETLVNPSTDVEMAVDETAVAEPSELPFTGEETVVEPEVARVPFIDYLSSPIVTLIVGSSGSETVLTAHQALLTQSPYFKDECDAFTDDGSVSFGLFTGSAHKFRDVLTFLFPPSLASSSSLKILTPLAVSSSSCTQANTSPRSSPASAHSNPIPPSLQSTRVVSSS